MIIEVMGALEEVFKPGDEVCVLPSGFNSKSSL